MKWLKSASASVWSTLSVDAVLTQAQQDQRTQEIRLMMLSTLGDAGALAYPVVRRRLIFATDSEALWYLRSEWVGAVAAIHGERIAVVHLRGINLQFEGLLPKAMSSRPSPLAHAQEFSSILTDQYQGTQ
jgi:hypothetical protein